MVILGGGLVGGLAQEIGKRVGHSGAASWGQAGGSPRPRSAAGVTGRRHCLLLGAPVLSEVLGPSISRQDAGLPLLQDPPAAATNYRESGLVLRRNLALRHGSAKVSNPYPQRSFCYTGGLSVLGQLRARERGRELQPCPQKADHRAGQSIVSGVPMADSGTRPTASRTNRSRAAAIWSPLIRMATIRLTLGPRMFNSAL
jgi:hypothetical protein